MDTARERSERRLLDQANFQRFRNGRECTYYGGGATRSPVRLTVPHVGHWHAVVDLGGGRGQGISFVRRLGNVTFDLMRALGALSLGDAFALCLLLALDEDPRRESALLRWHGRFELEAKSLTLSESQLVLAALAALPGQSAEEVIKEIARRRGVAA